MLRRVLLACILLAGCTQIRVSPSIHVPIGATCVVSADGLECTPAAPITYIITVNKSGSGNGTAGVSPAGAQPAGTPMTLTAAPDASSDFVGWSAGCTPSMPMPSQNITCTATFNVKSSGGGGGTGTWVARSVATGVYNWYYNLGAACPNGDYWIAWNGVTNRMPAGSNAWQTEATVNSMGWRENFAAICDENSIVHIAPGTSGPPEWSGFVTYNMSTKSYAMIAGGGCNAHSALGYFNNKLTAFGGWSTNCPIMARTASPAGAWAGLSPGVPPLTQEWTRETSRRGGVDSRTGNAWVLADNEELYIFNITTNVWNLVATTGSKPQPYAVVALHEASNTIVAVGGCRGLNDSDCGSVDNSTYLLDLTSKAWRAGPPSPEAMPMAKRHAVYSRSNQKIVLFTASYAPVNGRLGTNVYEWTPSGETPPPVKVNLTTVPAGNGQGTLTGGGSYAPGASVTLGATPATGSVFAGWNPGDPCGRSPFPMPSSALTCTGTFNAGTPPPLASCTPKAGEWVACPTPATGTPFPSDPAGSKDVNWAWDGSRLIFGAGDIRSSGVSDLYYLNLPAGTWEPMSVGCRPAGEVMMNHPSDRGPMIVDKRGELWNWNGVPYPSQEGQMCDGTGAIQKAGLLRRATNGVWIQATVNKTASLGGGAYDSVADSMLHFEPGGACSGNPGTLVKTLLPNLTQTSSPLCIGVNWNGATGGKVAPEMPERVFFGWDDAARKAYVVAPQPEYDASGYVIARRASLSVWDAKTGSWTARAPAPTGNNALVSYHTAVVWDSVNKRLLYPLVDNPCGEVRALYAYNPADDTWDSFVVPSAVHGSTVAFDPRVNALIVAGSVFCSDYSQRAIYLWQYPAARGRR